MIEALNILEGFNLAELELNSADYIHTLVEALKLAYADRDTYYGDPKFAHIPAERLLSKEYGAERRKLIGRAGVARVPAGQMWSQSAAASLSIANRAPPASTTRCWPRTPPAWTPSTRTAWRFPITPSGAWMPSADRRRYRHSAHRARAELSAGSRPSQRTGRRQAAARDPQPHAGGGPGQDLIALSTPGGDNQDQALLQVLFDAIEFGMNAEAAVEAPRFQTEHLVSSFDNHAMNPGSLLLDERMPPAVVDEMQAAQAHGGDAHALRQRRRAGDDPAASGGA